MSITALIRKQRWLAIAVSTLVLGLTTAPAIARMDCLSSGHSTYTIGERFDCCADEHPVDTPVLRSACCELSVTDPKKADYVVQAPAGFFAADLLPMVTIERLCDVPSGPARDALAAHSPPLPLDLRLSRIGCFLL